MGYKNITIEWETLRQRVSDLENSRYFTESDNRFRLLVQTLPDAVRITCDGILVYANDAAAKLFGARSVEELIGRCSEDFIPENERERLAARRRMLVANGSVPMEEQQRLRLDGSVVDVEILGIGITWHGKPAALNVIRAHRGWKDVEPSLRQRNAPNSRIVPRVIFSQI